MLHSIRVAFFLAYKSIIKSNKVMLVLTPVIMSVAFVNFTFNAGFFAGTIKTLDDQLINNLFSNIVIEPAPDKPFIIDVQTKQEMIESIPGVIATTARYLRDGRFSYDPENDGRDIKRGGYHITSFDPTEEMKVTQTQNFLIAGEYLDPTDRDKIVIGNVVAGDKKNKEDEGSLGGVEVGEEVTVDYGDNRIRTYKVKGIYKTGLDGIDSDAFVTEKEMESVLGVTNRADQMNVRIQQRGNEQKFIKKIKDMGIITDDKIKPWTAYDSTTRSLSSGFVVIKAIIGFVSMIIAAATIFIVMFINVSNKKRHIGILKAIGVNENVIVFSYILQTIVYASTGIIFGIVILLGLMNPYFKQNPINLGIGYVSLNILSGDFIFGIISLLVISLISGFIPTWRISKLPILKAIWGM